MYIEWLEETGGKTAIAVPTNDAGKDSVINLRNEFMELGWSVVAVIDRYPTFNFSASMNAGIEACLARESKFIGLSNDDVHSLSISQALKSTCSAVTAVM